MMPCIVLVVSHDFFVNLLTYQCCITAALLLQCCFAVLCVLVFCTSALTRIDFWQWVIGATFGPHPYYGLNLMVVEGREEFVWPEHFVRKFG